MVDVTDDFNRGDSTNLGANWIEDVGNFAIDSNQLDHETNPGAAYTKLRWDGTAMAGADNYSQILGRSNNSGVGVGAGVRLVASGTLSYYCYIGFGGDSCYGVWQDAGTENILVTGGSFSSSVAVTVRIEINGSNMEGFQNGSSDATFSDTNLTTGPPGVAAFSSLAAANRYIDDFAAGDNGAGAVSDVPAWSVRRRQFKGTLRR